MRLLRLALDAAKESGAEVQELNLLESVLPLFRPEGGYSEAERQTVERVRRMTAEAGAYILASPEYHGGMAAWMKNYFDFHYEEFAGKLFGFIAATGGSHGLSCVQSMRIAVQHCHGWELPYHASASGKDFDDDGKLRNAGQQARIARIGRDVTTYGRLLHKQFNDDMSEGADDGFAAWHRRKS